MPRQAEGPIVRREPDTKIYYVRFTHNNKRYEISTKTRDRLEAHAQAALIYSDVISGRYDLKMPTLAPSLAISSLKKPFLDHVGSEVAAATHKLFGYHVDYFVDYFEDQMRNFTIARVAGYKSDRLKAVLRMTLVHELTSMRRFLTWSHTHGYIPELFRIESPGKRVLGTADSKKHKRSAVPLNRQEARAVIERLPEFSRGRSDADRHRIRDFFIVLWETGLRPITLSKLMVPLHYRRGSSTLFITADIDKQRFARELDLTRRAREVLDAIAPESGLIFARHDFREAFAAAAVQAAADGVLDAHKASRVTAYDYRHGRITELVDAAGLPGAAFLAGHTNVKTTAGYVHAEQREGLKALEAAERKAEEAERVTNAAPPGDSPEP